MASTALSRPPNPACRVCGGEASGFHYGVDSCEGCKGFFRRCLTQGLTNKCTNDEKCEITPVSRNSCQFCRLKKCKTVGMSKEGSRLGRRPKRLKQCQGQTNESHPPVIQQPPNGSSSRYNRMYPNSTTATLSLQNAEFQDNYSHYHFRQLNHSPHLGVAGYQRSIKIDPDEQFLYPDQDGPPPLAKSRSHYKNGTGMNGRYGFDEKFSPSFHILPTKSEAILAEGSQFGPTHIKLEIQHCDVVRPEYASVERDPSIRNSMAWTKNGYQVTNSLSSEHLEEGEVPVRRVIGGGRAPADHKTSAWSNLDASPHAPMQCDRWDVVSDIGDEVFASKKTGRTATMFLQSDFENVPERMSSRHRFSASEEVAAVIVKTESMTSDDDEPPPLESHFAKSFPRHSIDHSFGHCVPPAIISKASESSHHVALSSANSGANGRNHYSTVGLKPSPTPEPTDLSKNSTADSARRTAVKVLSRDLSNDLYGLGLHEVKGIIPNEKLELINQVIDTVTAAHLNTCPYTTGKVAEGIEKFDELKKAGQLTELTPQQVWKHFVDNMTPVIQRVVKFSKRLPGFCEIGQEDQISLIKQGSFEVILIRYTKLFRGDCMFVPNMSILVPRETIEKMPLGDFFQEQLNFASAFNMLELSDHEVGLLSAIMIVCPDRAGLQNVKAIQQLNLLFMQSLYIHMQRTRIGSFEEIFDRAMEILPKIRRINEIHSIKVSGIKLVTTSDVCFPALHEEVFDEALC